MSKDTIYLDEKAKALTQEVVGGGEGGGVLIVHLTRGENEWLEQDKTNEEILEALSEGMVCCIYEMNEGAYNNALILRGFYNEENYYFDLITEENAGVYPFFSNNHFYGGGGSPA